MTQIFACFHDLLYVYVFLSGKRMMRNMRELYASHLVVVMIMMKTRKAGHDDSYVLWVNYYS